jgi:hypothetical protein
MPVHRANAWQSPVGLELRILALIPGLGNVAWRSASEPEPEDARTEGPRDALIQAIVELKSRNPRFGCPRIARTIAQTFGIDVDKNVVYRQWRGCSEWRRDAGSTSQSRTCRTDSRLLLIIRLAIPLRQPALSSTRVCPTNRLSPARSRASTEPTNYCSNSTPG